MSGRYLRTPTPALLAALLVPSLLVAGAPVATADAATDGIDLDSVLADLPLFLDLDVREPRHVLGGDGEVYVTADDELLVLDLEGDLVGLVDDLPGAGPMALSPDGGSLFVGLGGPREVVLLDVEDLTEVWSWELPGSPRSLVATDDLLLVGVGTASQAGDPSALVVITPDADRAPVVRPFSGGPLLAADAEGIVAAEQGLQPASVLRLTASGEVPDPPVRRAIGGSIRDLEVDASTGAVWIAGSGQEGASMSLHALDPATLATTRSVPLWAHPDAVQPLGDGRHVAGGRRESSGQGALQVHRLDGTSSWPVGRFDLPGPLVHRGLSLTSDGTLVALSRAGGGLPGGWLTVVPRPDRVLPTVTVDPRPPLPGRPIEVFGRVADAQGRALASLTVTVVDPRGGEVSATTDELGEFAVTLAASPLAVPVTVRVVVPGDAQRHPAVVERTFTPARRDALVGVDGHRWFVAGMPTVVPGWTTDAYGPRAGVHVTIQADGKEIGTATSGADGRFTFPFTAATSGTVTLRVSVEETDTHLAGDSAWSYEVRRDRPSHSVDLTTGTARSPATLSGRLMDGLGVRPVPGHRVEVSVRDAHGVIVTRRVTTDDAGRWTTTFTPRHGGIHEVTAAVAEDERFSPTSRTRAITIARATTTTTLAALPTSVDRGTSLTLTGRVAAPPGASLDLVAIDLASGAERRIARAQVDSTGRLSRTVTATTNTRYEARFRGDATYAPSATARTVRVRATVTARVSGNDRTVDGVPSFRYGSRPTVTGRVRSATPDRRVHVVLEQRRDGAWVTTIGWFVRPDADGRVSTRVPLELVDGRYRVRITTSETTANLQGRSPWVELRVRR